MVSVRSVARMMRRMILIGATLLSLWIQLTRSFYTTTTSLLISQRGSHRQEKLLSSGSTRTHFSNFQLQGSFIQDELRPYTMKLHPKELFQKKESNVLSSQQQTTKQDLLQFFCDSLKVYDTLETIIRKIEILSSLQNHGLERQEALKQDIEWLLGNDKSLTVPVCGQAGLDYSNYLEGLITPKQNIPKFICNFYNFYFAHTAGGVVVGKGLSKRLLNDAPLEFYQWKSGNMQELKKGFCEKIDSIAEKWTADEKKDCLGECLTSFRFAGSLLKYVTVPPDFGG